MRASFVDKKGSAVAVLFGLGVLSVGCWGRGLPVPTGNQPGGPGYGSGGGPSYGSGGGGPIGGPMAGATGTHDAGVGGQGGRGGVGGGAPIGPSGLPLASGRALDLLFMIDDSTSMKPLQAKLAAEIPAFMAALASIPGGIPDLHVAVVSSSLGAGKFGNVPGCLPEHPGDDSGNFQQGGAPGACPALHPGEKFASTASAGSNFDGAIGDVVACMTQLGDQGCGFESQLESVHYALGRALSPNDSNFGFLRENSALAVVMFTNEDDCSVAADSGLLDPSQFQLADPLGGLASYRCNEFGHLCDGVPPPHSVSGEVTLGDCISADAAGPKANLGHLTDIHDFVDFLNELRPANRLLFAALAGPTSPYRVAPHTQFLPNGQSELQPAVEHSCTRSTGEFADPAVRIQETAGLLGGASSFQSICADDFAAQMTAIAGEIATILPPAAR